MTQSAGSTTKIAGRDRFRAGRSCHDAIEQIYGSINQKAKFVLDADISKCFDCINPEALLRKLNTSPTIRRQIRAWLRAGVMDGKQLFPTSEGTPQGGTISPLLANIALHGMESRIRETFPLRISTSKKKRTRISSPNLIRYADDFVILHEDITVVQRCKEIISEWLKDMGLELKPSKTRLTHTLESYEGNKPGFDFLGFTIRQYPTGKHLTGTNSIGIPLGFTTIITPSQAKQQEHQHQIRTVIDDYSALPQAALIRKLNPIITGWSNYYSTVCSKETYSKQDHLMYLKLKAWAQSRHPKKENKWVTDKYWQSKGDRNWVFATKGENEDAISLVLHAKTPIVRHVKVRGEASPYDGNLIYWSTRMGKSPEMPKRVSTLLKRQKGKCPYCGLLFREEDVLEIDHKPPKSKR